MLEPSAVLTVATKSVVKVELLAARLIALIESVAAPETFLRSKLLLAALIVAKTSSNLLEITMAFCAEVVLSRLSAYLLSSVTKAFQ